MTYIVNLIKFSFIYKNILFTKLFILLKPNKSENQVN